MTNIILGISYQKTIFSKFVLYAIAVSTGDIFFKYPLQTNELCKLQIDYNIQGICNSLRQEIMNFFLI